MRDLAVLDLRDAEVRAALDVEPADLIRGRPLCQVLARRAVSLGAEGLIVPSAADAHGWNLVVFPHGFPRLRAVGSSVRNPAPPR